MKKKNLILLGLVIVLSFTVTGCKKTEVKEPVKDDIKVEDVVVDDTENIISENETNFTKVGEDGKLIYLDEESFDVELVRRALAQYGRDRYHLDYKTATGEEVTRNYTERYKKEFLENGEHTNIKNIYNENKLVEVFLSIKKIDFIKFEGNKAEAKVTFLTMYEEQEIDKARGWESNVPYHKPETLTLELVDNEWKIDSHIEFGEVYEEVEK